MKILFTAHQFLPDYSAGTEILTYSTAKEIFNRGHDVHIFTGFPVRKLLDKSKTFDRYEYEGLSVDRFFHSNSASSEQRNPMKEEYNNLFFANYFRNRIKELKPDVVHFYHLQRLSVAAIDVCHEFKIPTVFTATDYWLLCPTNQLCLPDYTLCSGPDKNAVNCLRHMVEISQGNGVQLLFSRLPDWLLNLFVKWSQIFPNSLHYASLVKALAARYSFMQQRMNRLDRVLVATRFMEGILNHIGLNTDLIHIIPFGIDHSFISRVSRKGIDKNLHVGFIGTLYNHKGAHILLEAVKLLPANTQLKLKIYGSLDQFPDYTNILRSIAGNDHRIEFCGTFQNSMIGEILYDLDVLIVPSLWYENTPLVIYSAQKAKVPVVASNLGGISEVIESGINGILFKRGDVKELASIIQMLCEDRKVLRKMSDNAIEPKSITNYVDELEQIYNDVILHCHAAS